MTGDQYLQLRKDGKVMLNATDTFYDNEIKNAAAENDAKIEENDNDNDTEYAQGGRQEVTSNPKKINNKNKEKQKEKEKEKEKEKSPSLNTKTAMMDSTLQNLSKDKKQANSSGDIENPKEQLNKHILNNNNSNDNNDDSNNDNTQQQQQQEPLQQQQQKQQKIAIVRANSEDSSDTAGGGDGGENKDSKNEKTIPKSNTQMQKDRLITEDIEIHDQLDEIMDVETNLQ